jgi:transposase
MPTCSAGWAGPGSGSRVLPDDEGGAIERHLRELDRLGEDLGVLDKDIAQVAIDDPAVKRLLTITGVNLIVAAGLVAAIGDVRRFDNSEKFVSYVGLNPRVRQSGLGLAQHGRISKHGRSHARAMLVEAAWAASKAPGPLRAFFLRIRARRGHQVAAVAVARKLAVLCWHLLTKETDYLWQRPALVANKVRAMELQAGQPAKKGSKRGPAYAYNVKELRDREMEAARQAEHATSNLSGTGSLAVLESGARVPPTRSDGKGCAAGLTSSGPALCRAVTRAGPD